MIDIRPQSSSKNNEKQTEIIPNIHQLADLTQNEPMLGMNKKKCFFFQIYFDRKFQKSILFNYRTNHNRV
jgi:hypothetical protein